MRITMPSKEGKRLKDQVMPLVDNVEDEDWADEWELVRSRSDDHWSLHLFEEESVLTRSCRVAQVALIAPGSFKQIDDLLQREVRAGKGSTPAKIEILSSTVVEGDERIE